MRSINKRLNGMGILIVKDTQEKRDVSGILGMNIIQECRELFREKFGPSYLRSAEKNTAVQNWNKAYKKSGSPGVKGFARLAGREHVFVPANSISVVKIV